MVPTLFGISVGIFLMVRLLPGDIIDILLAGDLSATEEVKQQAREQLGLSGSYPEQYWNWVSDAAQGDLGESLRNTEPVSGILLDAIPITAELIVLGLLIASVVGIPLGVISAVRRDSGWDFASRVGGLVGHDGLVLRHAAPAVGAVPGAHAVEGVEEGAGRNHALAPMPGMAPVPEFVEDAHGGPAPHGARQVEGEGRGEAAARRREGRL